MGRRIKSIAVFMVLNADGDEGIAAFPRRSGVSAGHVVTQMEPMIASTEKRLKELREVARDLVAGQSLRIVRFTREAVKK